jgi:hypothetical protein
MILLETGRAKLTETEIKQRMRESCFGLNFSAPRNMGAERPIAAPMQERLATGVRGSGIWPRSLKTVRALSFPGGYRFFPVVHFVRSKPKWGELPRWQGAAISGAE